MLVARSVISIYFKYLGLNAFSSDVVETVTSETETETWLKFRDETETLS